MATTVKGDGAPMAMEHFPWYIELINSDYGIATFLVICGPILFFLMLLWRQNRKIKKWG